VSIDRPPNAPTGIAYGLAVFGIACFAATLPLTAIVLADFTPLFITAARAVIAGFLALLVLLTCRLRRPARAEFRPLLISGFALIFGFPLAMAMGLQTVPAYHGAVVLGVLPLMTAGLSALVHGYRAALGFWLWALIGAGLVVVFVVQEEQGALGLGDVWLVAAALMASFGYVLAGDLSTWRPGWWVISWSLVYFLPLALFLGLISWPGFLLARPLSSLVGLVGLGVFSMYLGFFAWNAALAMGGVARIGQVQLLQVFLTLIWAWILLDEPLSASVWLFATLVMCSVYFGKRSA
jgi:drug/metabolite transporter (DMT)-like permease